MKMKDLFLRYWIRAVVCLIILFANPLDLNGQATATATVVGNEYTGRLDYSLGAHRLSGRLFFRRFERPFTADLNDYASMYTSTAARGLQPYNHYTVNDVYTLSPTLINSFTFS